MRRWIQRTLIGLGAATVVVAVLHVPIVARMAGGCPWKRGVAASPEVQEARRVAASRRLVGVGLVVARPADAFTLGVTTRAEVEAWAAARGGACAVGLDRRGLACRDAGDDGEALYADFAPDGVLVSLTGVAYRASAAEAERALGAARDRVSGAVGPPTRRLERALGGALGQARIEYRRANYFASLSATNLGPGRFLIARTYRAL